MKKQIDLELWHEDCWMLELTREFPAVELVVGNICATPTDILATITVRGGDTSEDVAARCLHAPGVRATDELDRSRDSVTLHVRYDIERSIYAAMVNASLTPIREIYIRDEREYWTVICNDTNVSDALASLRDSCELEIRRVADFTAPEAEASTMIDEVRNDISDRQLEYLLSALDEGYYSWPRNISAKELAEKHGVAGPTVLEHLRKGEAAIVRRALDQLRDRRQLK